MPFDPNIPAQNAELTSALFRGQFTGLKDLIDAIQGGITNVVVDTVNTLPAGSPPDVGVSLSGTELHFSFGIPQGQDGATGQPGEVSLTDLNNATQNTLTQQQQWRGQSLDERRSRLRSKPDAGRDAKAR
jgi:hypothetical protein